MTWDEPGGDVYTQNVASIACGYVSSPWMLNCRMRSVDGVSRVTLDFGSLGEIASKLEQGELDAGEYSLATYLMQVSTGVSKYIAIPVFPFRSFRHSMLWVARDGGINAPHQLVGKRIGIDRYGSTALVHVRGLLKHEYGVPPEAVTWIRVAAETPECRPPSSVEIEDKPGADLMGELTSGTVDAIASFWTRRNAQTPGVRRLFDDVRSVERAYYGRTGLYPIMHVIVLRRAVYETDTRAGDWLVEEFLRGRNEFFRQIDDRAAAVVGPGPWAHLDLEELVGDGELANPIGVTENRGSLESAVRDLYDQELIHRVLNVDDVFVTS